MAARGIVHAAEHPRRREYWVGSTTAATIAANAVAPGLLDRYLARTGFDSQQRDEPQDRDAPDNLFEPADRGGASDFGAHGDFDDQAHSNDPQLWASQHHGAVAAAAGGVLAGVGGLLLRRRR